MDSSKKSQAGKKVHAYEDAGFLRKVLEAVPVYVALVDRECRIVYVNRLQDGFVLEHVIGRSIEEFTSPEFHQRQREAVESAFRTGEPRPFLSHAPNPQGAIRYYEACALPVNYGDGERAVCIIGVEVTEHVKRADALRASEEKLRLLVEATGMGLWSWEVETNEAEWNTRMHEITGRTEIVAPGEYVTELVHPDDRAWVMAQLDDMKQHDIEHRLHRLVRPDGSVRWVMPCGRDQRDAQGKLIRAMGGTLDVTAQHQLEEHLRSVQRIDAVGALTAGVAHNFNNMLAVIVPTLDLLIGEVQDARKQLAIDAAHAAKRASELVAQLMTFAGQRAENEHKPRDLVPVVSQALSMCGRSFGERIAIERTGLSETRPVLCDAAALEQVIVNLMINARDAVLLTSHDIPRVRVDVSEVEAVAPGPEGEAPRPCVRIAVEDRGVGMNAKVKAHLFEPFFTTKESGHGTGLGLATSYGIVRDHGGFLRVDSKLGEGTTVAIYLPITRSTSEPTAARISSNAPQPRGTIFVIDDEAMVLAVVEAALSDREHQVCSASDSASLEKLFADGVKPDLILLDRSMPGFPVRQALATLRARAPGAPVVFFTGQDVPTEERALVEGVLYKPLSVDELATAVDRYLKARQKV